MRKLILASSSKYRRALLERLKIPFEWVSPEIDETARECESAYQLVERLSLAKAHAVANANPDALVIGSDQVAVFNNKIIGKPGSFSPAFKQLKQFSGNQLKFISGIAIVCSNGAEQYFEHSEVIVRFKNLSDQQIKNYLIKDEPYDCAGSFKVESLGIALFDFVRSEDPTSLEGLPLITLCKMLAKHNLTILE